MLLSSSLLAQWHPTKNSVEFSALTTQYSKKAWWQCNLGHEWEATPTSRSYGKGCPYCAGRKTWTGYNDLVTISPSAIDYWSSGNAPLIPQEVFARSTKTIQWLCPQGHSWQSTAAAFTKRPGCPQCRQNRVKIGLNDLASQYPILAAQWHPTKNFVEAQQVAAKSNKKMWWKCSQGHEWEASPSQRVANPGCLLCSGKKAIPGVNDLKTLRPLVAAQWHPTKNTLVNPHQVTLGSKRLVWWLCEFGHEWETRVSHRVQGSDCPFCAGQKVQTGKNDLQTISPYLSQQWHPTKNGILTPGILMAGSSQKVWWQCPQQHEWKAAISDRTRKNKATGCPRCTAHISSGEKDLFTFISLLQPLAHQSVRLSAMQNQELDIYVPNAQFAIEYNGVYWHSEAGGRDSNYHKNKQQACDHAGITLYQVWEDDWKTHPEIVLRGIAHRLGLTDQLHKILPDLPEHYTQTLGARQAKIVYLTYDAASLFMAHNHIQGSAVGTHYLGLVDSQERLRAVLILKRTGKTGELSIERYATAGVIPGGFSKLLKHAEKTYEPSRWVTFADLSLSDGGLYEKTGFTAEKVLKPDYSYLVGGQRVHKFNYRLKRFREDPDLLFEEGLTERELAVLNGLHRIWDSGKIRYTKTFRG